MLKNKLENLIKDFEGVAGIIVKDLDNKEEYSIKPEEIHRSASIIKNCILWELFNQANKSQLNLEEKIVVKKEDMVGGCGILKEFNEGLELTLKEVATFMIIQSDNTATNILIDRLGMDNINKSMEDLGLKDTSLNRKMMDTKAVEKGIDNYTSSRDMALLLEIILDTKLISEELKLEMLDILKRQQLKDLIPATFPEDIVFAHKTGGLSDIDHDVGILMLEDKNIIIVSMLKDVKNKYNAKILQNQIGKAILDNFMPTNI